MTDRKVDSLYTRGELVFGKDILVEPVDKRVDVTKRETSKVAEFKADKKFAHNKTVDKK